MLLFNFVMYCIVSTIVVAFEMSVCLLSVCLSVCLSIYLYNRGLHTMYEINYNGRTLYASNYLHCSIKPE